jgi:hypothetical protein
MHYSVKRKFLFHAVINGRGTVVFRGSLGACQAMCGLLNTIYEIGYKDGLLDSLNAENEIKNSLK